MRTTLCRPMRKCFKGRQTWERARSLGIPISAEIRYSTGISPVCRGPEPLWPKALKKEVACALPALLGKHPPARLPGDCPGQSVPRKNRSRISCAQAAVQINHFIETRIIQAAFVRAVSVARYANEAGPEK